METISFYIGKDGRMWASRPNKQPIFVQGRRCFPWRCERAFISIRDDKNNEVFLVENMSQLDLDSQTALEIDLEQSDFIFVVERVLSIETEFEIRNWNVETAQGPMRFQTKIDDWPKHLSNGTTMIRDVANNLYRLPEYGSADVHTRQALAPYLE